MFTKTIIYENFLKIIKRSVFFSGLAFTPSCLIALNENLDMPKVSFKSNAKPSTYGYPAPLEEKKKEAGEKVNI